MIFIRIHFFLFHSFFALENRLKIEYHLESKVLTRKFWPIFSQCERGMGSFIVPIQLFLVQNNEPWNELSPVESRHAFFGSLLF